MKRNFLLLILLGLTMSLQSFSQQSAAYEWSNVTIGGGGFVSGIFFSPIEQNVMYTRTDVGGAYRWDEATQSWISMMDWVNLEERGLLGIEALAIDPNVPGKVYMMAGTVYWNQAADGIGRSAFLRSDDYGQTWEKIPVWDNSTKYFNVHGNGMGRGTGERLAVDPSNSDNMFYGTRNKGLWRSTNNGSTWTKVTSFPVDTTWNGCGISFVAFDPSNSDRIYAGVFRKADNIFISEDGGATWSLIPGMPQPTYNGNSSMGLMPGRIAIKPDGSEFYTTLGNGAGPHTMQWDEGWGPINDWYNRGAVYKYNLATATWSDISPQNLIDPEGEDWQDPSEYFGTYSGISINPDNPDHLVVSSCASYRGPQFWLEDGTWYDEWGDNIFVTEDGGETWVPSFEYYWLDGGMTPPAEQMDENGIPWMFRSTIHWIGSTAIDPFNPQRVFITSGNGVFKTENIFNYEWSYVNDWGGPDTSYTQYTVWQVASHGIEEVVPEDVVSIPDGPLVSVIGDYDGFVHTDLTTSPATGRHKLAAAGGEFSLGSTTGLAYAPLNGRLAKCAKAREVSTEYNAIPIGPVQWSDDQGLTWSTETYTTNPPTDLSGGRVGISADGEVTLWMPSEGTAMYRNSGSQWSTVSGISFSGRPEGDKVNENIFYAFNKATGYMYVSTDKGVSFSQAGLAGESNFRNAHTVPGQEGHVWVPIATEDGGALMRSSDAGATFTAVEEVGYCEAVGFGKAADGADYPTVFAYAEINGVTGVWRSTDQGASWLRVNDDAHEYGGLANGEFVVGDMNVFGRVYMSTAGRGIVYGDPTGSSVPVTGVAVSPSVADIAIGESVQLTAAITPSTATNKSVSWNSGNSAIAMVSSTGEVTGVSTGTTSVTVTTASGGYIATAQITVSGMPVEDITVSPVSVTLDPNETAQITATITPSNATNQNIAWSTSDAAVATVDGSGLITAISDGSATITATTEDGGYTASTSVTVNFVETPVTGVSISPVSQFLQPGETTLLEAAIEPVNATNKNVVWSSDNIAVASVDALGQVTALAEGEATIMVTTEDGGFTASALVTVSQINSGSITAEYWRGISGTTVGDLTSSADYPHNPTETETLSSLEIPVDQDNNYGTRIRGYIVPATSGDYTFWIAGDDYCDLYLSTDASADNASRIGYVEGWNNSREWDKYPSQQSSAVSLVAGQHYYIEALHKEGYGGDNLAVAWEGPGISRSVIEGAYLLPYEDNGNNSPIAAISASPLSGDVPLEVSFSAAGSSDPNGDALSYNWTFGDGNTGTGVAPIHTYTSAGSFTASVSVSDGNGGSDEASVNITVTDPTLPQYTLTTNTMGTGSISLNPAGGIYEEGTEVILTANAGSEFVFDSWSGDASGSATSITVIMNSDKTVTATFTEVIVPTYSLTVNIIGEGSVSPTGGTFDENEVVNLVATASSGYQFEGWSGDISGSSALASLTMDADKVVTATFVEDTPPSGCDNPVAIDIPFVQNGAGQYCWVTGTEIAYINSWNLNELTINGVDYTNTWSNSLPPANANGEWVIYYDGPYGWSHFEAPSAKSAESAITANALKVYPNPFENGFTVDLGNLEEVSMIEIVSPLGQVILQEEIADDSLNELYLQINDPAGIYVVRIHTQDEVFIRTVVKND